MALPDPEAWGIAPGYHDISGAWRQPGLETRAALLRAMRAEGEPPPVQAATLVVRQGAGAAVDEPALITSRPVTTRWSASMGSGA
jgi:hypothetical protein